MVKKEHRYICNDGYIKEHSIDDLSECIVVHNRKQALKIFANINRIFDDYLSKAGLEGIEYYRQYFEISVRKRWKCHKYFCHIVGQAKSI